MPRDGRRAAAELLRPVAARVHTARAAAVVALATHRRGQRGHPLQKGAGAPPLTSPDRAGQEGVLSATELFCTYIVTCTGQKDRTCTRTRAHYL